MTAPSPSTKGAAPGELGQRPWHNDIDILMRVRRVHSLTKQGLFASKIAKMLKVSERTVHEDRARYLELAREDIKTDIKSHIASLQTVIDEATIAFHALGPTNTFAIKRSDYLNIIRQAQMDIAKLDGSLAADRLQVGIAIQVGPSLQELRSQGKLTDAQYEASLVTLALQSGAAMGQVIEGEASEPAAEEPEGASPPPTPVLRRQTSSPPSHAEAPLPPEPPFVTSELAAAGLAFVTSELAAAGLADFSDEVSDFPEEDEDDE